MIPPKLIAVLTCMLCIPVFFKVLINGKLSTVRRFNAAFCILICLPLFLVANSYCNVDKLNNIVWIDGIAGFVSMIDLVIAVTFFVVAYFQHPIYQKAAEFNFQ